MKFLYFIPILLLITSCDPVRILTLKTKAESTSIKIYLKNNKIMGFEKSGNPIEVSAQKEKDFTAYFTIGYWDDENIQQNLTQNIDSIVIQTNKRKEFYKSPESIQQFLKKNRKIFSKSKIEITR